MQKREIEIDLRDLFKYLMKKFTTIAFVVILTAAAAFGAARLFMTPVYESQSMIYITTSADGGNVVQNMLSTLQAGTALTADYKTLATSKPVLEQTIDELKLDMTYEQLKSQVSTVNPDNTRILTIKVKNTDPRLARDIVNTLTKIEQVQIANIMNTTKPNVVQWGDIPTSPVSASPMKMGMNCGIIAFLLMIGFFTIRFIQNDMIISTEDIEKALNLRNLAEIPKASNEKEKKKKSSRKGRKKEND